MPAVPSRTSSAVATELDTVVEVCPPGAGGGGSSTLLPTSPPPTNTTHPPSTLLSPPPGNVFDLYERHELLGEGQFAQVYRVVHRHSGIHYALKTIRKGWIPKGKEALVVRELQILGAVAGHPNIVGLRPRESFYETDEEVHLIMELCEGGELFDVVMNRGSLEEPEAASILRQVLEALVFLHARGIVHRDLKLENLLIREKHSPMMKVMLSDFGLSKALDMPDQLSWTTCGTPSYLAPEIVARAGHNVSADLWSLGCIAFSILSGNMPFHGSTSAVLYHRILTAHYEFEPKYWNGVSAQARDFIRRLLTLDPDERMTAAEALRHPWMRQYPPAPAPSSTMAAAFPFPSHAPATAFSLVALRRAPSPLGSGDPPLRKGRSDPYRGKAGRQEGSTGD